MTRMTILPLIGLLFCTAGEIGISCVPRFYVKLFSLAGLYLGSSLMMMSIGSIQMCASLLICGIGCTVLIGSGSRDPRALRKDDGERSSMLFRLLLALALAVPAYTAAERLRLWIPIRRNILFTGLWICLLGLTGLSLDDDLMYRCVYLQALCLAFTLCYIYMESSILVFACFAAINLLMAFGCSVLTNDRYGTLPEPKEEDQ